MQTKLIITRWLAGLAISIIILANSTALAHDTSMYPEPATDNGPNFTGMGQSQLVLVTSTDADQTATTAANAFLFPTALWSHLPPHLLYFLCLVKLLTAIQNQC